MKSSHVIIPLVLLTASVAPQAQSFYFVSKQQLYLQTSTAGVAADPLGSFKFQAKAATSATLIVPGGSTVSQVVGTRDHTCWFNQKFATKTAFDATLPDGSYRFTGAGNAWIKFGVEDHGEWGTARIAGHAFIEDALNLRPRRSPPRAQPQTREQQQDRVIAPAGRSAAVAGREHLLHCVGRKRLRQVRHSPVSDRRDGPGEVPAVCPR